MSAPVSLNLQPGYEDAPTPDVTLALPSDALFSVTVGPSVKKTLAGWHVTTAHEVVDAMLEIVGEPHAERPQEEEEGK